MTLSIGRAFRDGFRQLASRTGAILLGTYFLVFAIYWFAFNALLKAFYTRIGFEEVAATIEPALEAPLGVSGAVVAICAFLLTYHSVVAVRTFVAGERTSIPSEFLTDSVVFAILNVFVGGIVFMILVAIGSVLVIPGIFLYVSLLFMTMYVAVENENFVTAMRRSWHLTEGERFSVFGLLLAFFGIGVVGTVFAILGFVVALGGVSQTAVGLLNVVIVVPLSLYGLAVLSNAFNQLRTGESDEPGAATTATDTPSSPVA